MFDLADIRRSFDAATLARGRDYLERLRVVDVRSEGGRIEAQVAGSQRNRYAVTVRVDERGGHRRVVGACSCPVHANCKHAAATALSQLPKTDAGRKRDAADGAVDSWTESLAARTQPARRPSGDHIRYTIDVAERYYVPRFELKARIVPLLKSGELGVPRSLELHSLARSNAKHVTPVDRTIGRLVEAGGLLGGLGAISPTILGTLLDVLVASGRAHWRTLESAPLRREPLLQAGVHWQIDDDGRRRLHLADRSHTRLIAAAPLWYVDGEHLTAGPVDIGLDAETAALLAGAPSLTEEQARRTSFALRSLFPQARIEWPKAPVDERIVDENPVPMLRLSATDDFAIAELQFAYGRRIVRPSDEAREFHDTVGEHVWTWPRRPAFERQSVAKLADFGLTPIGWPHLEPVSTARTNLRFAHGEERRWIHFLGAAVPQLRAEGWRVEIDERFPYVIVDAGEQWDAQLTESEARWFELDLGIEVDGERVPLLPILIGAIAENGIGSAGSLTALAQRGEPIFGKLPSGAYVALPAARVARVLATLVELFDGADALSEQGRLQIASVRAAAIADLDGEVGLRWSGARSLRALVDALGSAQERGIEVPRSFHGELRPYQRDGVAWLQVLREHGFGGVLADDMGLGKTVQLLAHLAIERAQGRLRAPALIVAPTSVVPNWRAEIARFAPDLRVLSLTGADRAERFGSIDAADVVLTTYALLPRDAEQLLGREWSIGVLDEAQAIKNPRAKAALAARQLRAEQRIALTGTPIENHLEELWSIYAFAVPGLLGERARFARFFRTPIEKHADGMRRSALAARLRPFLLRRTKERVARELPPKTEIVQRIELGGSQRDLYETIRLAMHRRVREEVARRGLARSRIVVLDALLKLRQVCCDPRLLKLPAAQGVTESQKLETLLEMLESLIEDGRRVLLFSQFTSMLDLIAPELRKRKIPFVELRGDTRDRETPVARFQSREVPLFLISLKAGGTGLNLTAADTVIHYDPWWNPAVERQATDRAHRIGQDQHVFVYKLIAEGTVEERILELQERKGALAADLFEETSTAPLRLEIGEIERLFS